MVTDVDACRYITYRAAWAIASEQPADDVSLAVHMAKAWCSGASRRVVAHGQQIHGGIGFTKEHRIQLFFRRQKRGELAFGDADVHREAVAQLLGL
jgi:alkylation response protein AidB-like acyl-CoA dehydrogenase